MGIFDKLSGLFGGKDKKEEPSASNNTESSTPPIIPAAAEQLHQEARQLGAQGQYDLAIEKLKKAQNLAPNWAYPVYDMGFTYLLKQDFPNALKYYGKTDQMEPKGFFTTKTAYWSLKKESEGVFQQGLYLAFMQIEWRETDEEKLHIAKAIVDKFPAYAPAWEVIASKSDSPEDRLAATEKGLAANPDDGTKGSLLINKALVFSVQEKTEAAKNILQQVIANETTTTQHIGVANFVLTTLVTAK